MKKVEHDSETLAEGQQVITAVAFIHAKFDGVTKVFLPKRADTKKFLPGVFELLGGHIDFGEELDKKVSFLDTAGVIKNLDLVITADTAIAHLAGSMGTKVWLLLSYMPICTWLLNTNKTKWYPSMKLFRQTRSADWKSVFNDIEQELNTNL